MIAWLALSGCGWNTLPQGNSSYVDPLWDPQGAVVSTDGLYFRLLESGGLVRVSPGEQAVTEVDIGEGIVTRIDPTPDADGVVALIERFGCVADEADLPRRPVADDCPRNDLVRTTELTVVRDAKAAKSTLLDGTYNAVRVSADGDYAVAWLDLATLNDVDDVVNLTGVAVLDVARAESVLVPVGFAPERVLFTEDDAGNTVRAVVLSRNQVALLELGDGPPRRTVTFPLALDDDESIDPLEVALTPDGRFALVTAVGRSDLYVLDLEDPAINIVELAGTPSAMVVVDDADLTALVFRDEAVLQLVDHASFSSRTVPLEESMDRILVHGGELLLHGRRAQHDVYRYGLESGDLVEYRTQNPVSDLVVSPDGGFAVALTTEEFTGEGGVDAFYDQNPGMEILELGSDESTPFLLEGDGLGLAFDEDGRVLLLQQGQDYLYRYDLFARTEDTVRLSVPPRGVGALADGTLFVTQDAAFGLVSFLTLPEAREVGGFAVPGLVDPVGLVDLEAP